MIKKLRQKESMVDKQIFTNNCVGISLPNMGELRSKPLCQESRD